MITPTAPTQRLLLALLASAAGRPVSSDGLIDALWGGEPPARAAEQLRWHLHHLRRRCGEHARLGRTAGGHVLELGDGQLDAAEFERLCRDGIRCGDPARAAALLAAALRLCRGTAYQGFTEPRLLAESRRLESLRLTALEHRVAADLDLGRHADAVGELRALVAAHPLREGLREQLMLALHRCGRPAEALAVFRNGRDLSVDRLGLEPGERLGRLARRIRSAAMVPVELPADPVGFIGRRRELSELERLILGGAHRTIALWGPAGVGKSTLAVHAAHRVTGGFPDGQLYVNLRGAAADSRPLGIEDLAPRLLRSLRHPAPPGSDAAALRSLLGAALRGRRVLIVLDDAPSPAPLLDLPVGCQALVTTRAEPYGAADAHTMRLGLLSHDDACRLLTEVAGRESDPADTRRVAELCGRLPLALSIAGARLRSHPQWPIRRLLDLLRHTADRLDQLSAEDRAVRSSFDVGYRAVVDGADGLAAARLFRTLGANPGRDIGAPAAAALADVTEERARRLLRLLVRAQLVEEHRPHRYQLHDLLRLYAQELAGEHDPASAHEPAIPEPAEGNGSIGQRETRARRKSTMDRESSAGGGPLEHEPAKDNGSIGHRRTPAERESTMDLGPSVVSGPSEHDPTAGNGSVGQHGTPAEREPTMDRASAAARRPSNPEPAADSERAMESESSAGREAVAARDRLAAWYLAAVRRVFALAGTGWLRCRTRVMPDDIGDLATSCVSSDRAQSWVESEIDNLIAVALCSRDDIAVAIAVLVAPVLRNQGLWRHQASLGEAALHAAERGGEPIGLFFVRHDLASVKRYVGALDEALRLCEANLSLARTTAEPGLESNALALLGEVNRLRGAHDAALDQLTEALRMSAGHRGLLDESVVHMRLGLLHRDAGRPDAALAAQERALAIARDLDDPWNQVSALGNVGYLLRSLGRLDESAARFERSLRLAEAADLGGTALHAEQHWGYAETLHDLGEFERARSQWTQAADILRSRALISPTQHATITQTARPPIPSILDS